MTERSADFTIGGLEARVTMLESHARETTEAFGKIDIKLDTIQSSLDAQHGVLRFVRWLIGVALVLGGATIEYLRAH
jgi:hypothetical protein